jgi:hypothetical protein
MFGLPVRLGLCCSGRAGDGTAHDDGKKRTTLDAHINNPPRVNCANHRPPVRLDRPVRTAAIRDI